MKKLGFIGLGTMGLPMAKHLLSAGYELTVFNRTRRKADPLIKEGAQAVSSPAEVARHSEVVITMLSNDSALEEVVLGDKGIVEAASPGLIMLDSSTVSPTIVKELAQKLADIGVDFLDCPVTGSEPQAIEGVLTFMVGGKKEVYERCKPLFKVMGKEAYYMGESGSGAYTKLANNTMAAINLLSLAEAMVMASKAGIDPEMFVKVVSGGGARSGMMDAKAPKMINRDFHPHFKTALMHKDLGLALDLAQDLGIPVPVLSLVRQMLHMSMSKGFSEEDMCAVVKCYEEWAGMEIKK